MATASINIALELLSLIISLMVFFCSLLRKNKDSRLHRLFPCMLFLNTFALLCDLVTWIFRSSTAPALRPLLLVSNFFVYSLGYLILALFIDYLLSFLAQRGPIPRHLVRISYAFCAFSILLILISQFNHMYYYFDEANRYIRGDYFIHSQIYGLLLLLASLLLIPIYHKRLRTSEVLALLSYGVFPLFAILIQLAAYGLTLLYVATTLSLLLLYIVLQLQQEKRLYQQELELVSNRVAIMLSQIQPHFLYNALNTIQYLCQTQPQKAAQVIEDFAAYLRGNMDSLTQQSCIPFEEDLTHLEHYLQIERLRFPFIEICYALEERHFSLPALTLQPLVENAIRYGFHSREEAGSRILIASCLQNDHYLLTIEDNGEGFDPAAVPSDGRSHLGIPNTRSRIESMCGGTLHVETAPGSGTRVQISIPREEPAR